MICYMLIMNMPLWITVYLRNKLCLNLESWTQYYHQSDPLKYAASECVCTLGNTFTFPLSLIAYNFNLEIRVGGECEHLGNGKICFTASDGANSTCLQAVFGDWISINKSTPDSSNNDYDLILCEIHVFGSKYSNLDTPNIGINSLKPKKWPPFRRRPY